MDQIFEYKGYKGTYVDVITVSLKGFTKYIGCLTDFGNTHAIASIIVHGKAKLDNR